MPTDIEKRHKIAQEWIDNHEFIRDQFIGKTFTDLDSELQYVRGAGFGVPIINEHGQWGLSRWHGDFEDCFYLVPILPEDVELHDYFKSAVNSIRYDEVTKSIYLPPWKMSRKWRALLLSHELCHTIAHRRGWYRRKKLGYWAEEVDIYRAEAHLARRLYGRKYQDVVLRLAKKFEALIRAKGLQFEDKKVLPNKIMDNVLVLQLQNLNAVLSTDLSFLMLYTMHSTVFINLADEETICIAELLLFGLLGHSNIKNGESCKKTNPQNKTWRAPIPRCAPHATD